MGRAAWSLSDVAFLTSDNPRTEDPLAIIDEVRAGLDAGQEDGSKFVVEPDRHQAIRRALDAAQPGDVVVLAGKGHETYQEINGVRVPFDDAVEARHALSVRFSSEPDTWIPSAAGRAVAKGR
jgi:UDP-N-acetylmuramoyl-L-alanyl-D-glutamate--2,6-diaminopimelate ligase